MSSPKRLLEALVGSNAPGDGGLSREAAQALSEKIVKMSKADAINVTDQCRPEYERSFRGESDVDGGIDRRCECRGGLRVWSEARRRDDERPFR